MRRIKLHIEYDGTGFAGFQRQGKGERTVQGVLEAALRRLPGARPKVVAAGRTDAGVHALDLPLHYDTEDRIPIERVPLALNALLPPDVRVLRAEHVPLSFHARKSARWRAYRYLVRVSESPSAIWRYRAHWLRRPLELAPIRVALDSLVGAHDFKAFATRETRPTKKRLFRAEVWREGSLVVFEFVGDGFLRGQVRTMVGTLIEVGLDKRAPEDVARLLESGSRAQAGPSAPPQGLYFVAAGYRPYPSR